MGEGVFVSFWKRLSGSCVVTRPRRPFRCPSVVNCVSLLLLNLFLSALVVLHWTPEETYFVSALDSADRSLLDRTLRAFVAGVERANVSYFMTGGTLIGSLRHHGPIPWDDDADFLVSASDKPRLRAALTGLDPDFGLFVKEPEDLRIHHWKLFPTDGRLLDDYPDYRTPFVDIWFYHENATHIWNMSPEYRKTDVWPKDRVFPLVRRPFDGLLLPAPCDSLGVAAATVNISMCLSRSWDHLSEGKLFRSVLIPCERLSHIFPFVRREIRGSVVRETLGLRNWIISEVTLQRSC